MGTYNGKTAVATGGTSGLGRATARLLLARGARVLVTGRTEASVDQTRDELGGDAIVVQSDTASLTEIDALADRARFEFGTLGCLLVNAGITRSVPFEEMTEAQYDEVFAISSKGPYFTVQRLAPLMTTGSAVVLTTSVTGILERSLSAADAEQARAQMTQNNPMKRFGHPEEVAKAVAFLAFDATFTTGAELPVDGGVSQL